MPLGLAILTFFAAEFLVALTIQNLETGFFPSVFAGVLAYWFTASREQKIKLLLDHPALESYDMPIKDAYATVKKVLKTFHYGKRRWRLEHLEKSTYSMAAVSEWQDHSWKDHKILVPDGCLERKIILQLAFRRNCETKLTELGMKWHIDSPLGRAECNDVQAYTTDAIRTALKNAMWK